MHGKTWRTGSKVQIGKWKCEARGSKNYLEYGNQKTNREKIVGQVTPQCVPYSLLDQLMI